METELIDELVEETVESQSHTKIPRAELVLALAERDGTKCMYPGCGAELDFTITDGPREVTIDHWMPQHFGKANGWTWDRIWALDNLLLMEKKCNAKKGDRVPNADGTLPERITRDFRYRRQKRAERADICTSCNAGRNLDYGEVCASCSSGPMPERFPRWAKMRAAECDHELFWCAWCSIGVIPRASAASVALLQGESGEWD